MNYHTFELAYSLTPFENKSYTDLLYKSGKTYIDKYEYVPTVVCETLKKHGIIIKIQQFTKNEYTHYVMYYRINPRRVMEKNNYIGLFNAKDTDRMMDKVNKHLKSINMPSADNCKIHRIDFCTNIVMSGQDEIFEYIKLLQRGFYPKKYESELFYDMTAKRSKFPKNSCNIIKKKLVKITYYNKYDQLQENKYCQNTEEAINILRAEIQCEKRKVRHLIDKFGYTKVRTFLKHSDEMGNYVFNHYANKFCGSGDFYKIDEIYRKIDKSKVKTKSKEMMKELIWLSAKHSSVQKAIHKLRWNYKTTSNILKKFDNIGVSPIVIPIRSEYDFFPNPLTLALKSCNYS